MANIDTLTAYKCTFSYLKRNNPLKEELKDKIKQEILPEYNFDEFIEDFSEYTSSLIVGKNTKRAILLPKENIYSLKNKNDIKQWRIVPYAGKQGLPLKIIKTDSGKAYDFNSKSAALYEHKIFLYQSENSSIAIFHRQNGSGCKSIFLEIANKMLHEKGIKLNMELYLPLVSKDDSDITPTKIQLQYVRKIESADVADNLHKRKRSEVIQELGLNLESQENMKIKQVLQDMKIGKISQDVAFVRIKNEYPDTDYNDAKLFLRIGKRTRPVQWNELDSILGCYDISYRLHEKFKHSGDFIGALTDLSDEYYNSIVAEGI